MSDRSGLSRSVSASTPADAVRHERRHLPRRGSSCTSAREQRLQRDQHVPALLLRGVAHDQGDRPAHRREVSRPARPPAVERPRARAIERALAARAKLPAQPRDRARERRRPARRRRAEPPEEPARRPARRSRRSRRRAPTVGELRGEGGRARSGARQPRGTRRCERDAHAPGLEATAAAVAAQRRAARAASPRRPTIPCCALSSRRTPSPGAYA